ncbi:protein of unknown function [Nitrospira japonica]|uniref:Uncharacterized protein n=1 Tax=Nitrospira japonica TaxID=1325564 RepID=A0A1W1I5X4_9BACT|nr:protein of unknown function [Nitrospira japonica]
MDCIVIRNSWRKGIHMTPLLVLKSLIYSVPTESFLNLLIKEALGGNINRSLQKCSTLYETGANLPCHCR